MMRFRRPLRLNDGPVHPDPDITHTRHPTRRHVIPDHSRHQQATAVHTPPRHHRDTTTQRQPHQTHGPILACGHPDNDPHAWHDDGDPTRPVCADCCHVCNPEAA